MAAESARLAAIKVGMDEQQRAAVVQLAADLVTRQGQVDDESILPKVELNDVPASLPDLSFTESDAGGIHTTTYGQGTNGIVYQQVIAPLPRLSSDQLQLLPLYTSILTELGLGNDSYLEAQHRQAATVGAINAFSSMRGHVEDEQAITANFVLSSKALLRNAEAQAQLMHDTLHTVRFDETDRIRDLIAQQRARRDQSITGNGHGLAMAAACAGMSPLAQLNHQLSGLAGIDSLRALDDRLRDPQELDAFAAQLGDLHSKLKSTPMQFLAIAEDHRVAEVVEAATAIWTADNPDSQAVGFELQPIRERRGEIWLTNTQVNFCARAYPTVPVQHPDAAALTVLGGVLRNGFLHRAIREQGGAYGGGASQDSGVAAFRFYSYRDPRLAETLQDFDAAVTWMLETPHEYRALEEAILGVIGSMDKPSSPAGEAKQHFHNRLFGRSHDQRELFRRQILAVSLDDLRRVTETYLQPELASTAVVTSSSQLDSTASLREELDLTVREL
jgi:Zn-dependent M16 (insulinase) family peptidase